MVPNRATHHIFAQSQPMAPKLSRMSTYVDRSLHAKPSDTSISWSCYKNDISFVIMLQKRYNYHMAYGLWHWLRMREHHLKIYNSHDTSTTCQIENVMPIFFSTMKLGT